MAFIPTNAAQIQQFAGALYGLTVGTQTMAHVLGEVTKTSLDAVLNTYFTATFGRETTQSVAQRLVDNLGVPSASRTVAVDYVNGLLAASPAANRGVAVKDILATFSGLTADATFGAAARAWNAKVDAAVGYSGVADVPFSPAANSALPTLTFKQDILRGTAGADVFVARVVQNDQGMQTNSLGTGDVLLGDAGADALLADVVMASTLASQPMSPIRPETRGIEFAHFTALESDQAQNNEVVMINAAKMHGLSRVGSIGSDASVTIYNLTTLTDSGAYADRRNTSAMTVRMDHSGNDSAFSADVESDMTVLFDQNYLLAGQTSTSRLNINAVNNVELVLSNRPLAGITEISFSVAGRLVRVDLAATANQVTTYDGLRQRIAGELTSQGITGVTVEVMPGETSIFSANVNTPTRTFVQGEIAGQYLPIRLTSTVGALAAGTIRADLTAPGTNYYNNFTSAATDVNDPVTVNVELHKVGRGGDGGDLTIGGMSTDFNLGNNPDSNVLNRGTGAAESATVLGRQGVHQFNVVVEGDVTQPSDLASLQSTNNALRTVNVVAASGSQAGLIIGNRETDARGATVNGSAEAMPRDLTTFRNAGLKDVRDFNAASFNNGVELHSWVSDESVGKYMNRVDRAPGLPADDNANFVYAFGTGNDTLNINISKANLAASGTTNREDFSFVARTGAGNDTVLAQIGDGQGLPTDIWYLNHVGQANISIDAGAGSDTIRTYGSSAWSIVAGEGDDVVYTDNSGALGAANASQPAVLPGTGTPATPPAAAVPAVPLFNAGRASWVIAANQNVDDLRSTAAVAGANQYLYGSTVRVVLSDAQSADAVAATNGFESVQPIITPAGVGNQLHLNQAIKLAINADPVLSRLLIAEDGPGNTLVIRALIDGGFRSEDLSISVVPLTEAGYALLSTGQLADALAAYRTVQGDSSAVAGDRGANIVAAALRSAAAFNDAVLDAQTPRLGQQGGVDLSGAESVAENANRINPGPGNDVIVLSTDASSVETIVYTGSDTGQDTIVNFFNDRLVFDSYLTNRIALTGATVARTWVDQSGAAGAFGANNIVVTSFGVLNGANPSTTLTYAGLTADQVLGELRATPTLPTTPPTPSAGFTTAGLDVQVGAGNARKSVLMVQNDANLGQYQVFDVTFGNSATGGAEDWTSVVRLGQIDVGQQLTVAATGVSRAVDGGTGGTGGSAERGTAAQIATATFGILSSRYLPI